MVPRAEEQPALPIDALNRLSQGKGIPSSAQQEISGHPQNVRLAKAAASTRAGAALPRTCLIFLFLTLTELFTIISCGSQFRRFIR